ncbi:integrator complex subunit 9-like isoform X2 [Oscarella lobularis]|uniref:integrator complex subunit 9-like isoform X2 n=1 Tax=Oscarella lobularis TaxID=121494 RepID=UPI003313932A
MTCEIVSLGSHPFGPCFLLKFKDVTLLLDCAIDFSSLRHFLPIPLIPSRRLANLPTLKGSSLPKEISDKLKDVNGQFFLDGQLEFCIGELDAVNLSTVDAILVTCYQNMLGLPYITEYLGFKGKVYATEPTIQLGQQTMLELIYMAGRVTKQPVSDEWKSDVFKGMLPSPLMSAQHVDLWKHLYSETDVMNSLSKIHSIGYSQKIDLHGSAEMIALSSGYCLGSCNWLIQTAHHKISYLASSSQFSTHPLPLDCNPMRNSDVLLLSGLTEVPAYSPDVMVGELCTALATTLRNGGNVLVPCFPAGVIYDLLECLPPYMDGMGLQNVPIYFLSPAAETSLAYSNIFGEWLCKQRQEKMYQPEPPFSYADLIKSNRIRFFKSVSDSALNSVFKTPCVVFCGHPSLRCGDVVHFMEAWGGNSQNAVIFTEPNFPYHEALAPYQGQNQSLPMQCLYFPIDPRLDFQQIRKLLKDIQPKHTIVPDAYLRPPLLHPRRIDLVLEQDGSLLPYTRGHVCSLPMKFQYVRASLSSKLARDLVPREIHPGVFASSLKATIYSKDNRHELGKRSGRGMPRLVGNVSVDNLVQDIEKEGGVHAEIEETKQGFRIILNDVIVSLELNSIQITSHGNVRLRRQIIRALESQLQAI